MTERSEGMDVPLERIVGLRLQMAAEGWESEDRMTSSGWRAGIGYSIWFERWEWHGQNTFKLTGSRACYHAHVGPPLDQNSMLRTAREAAARARQAYANFADYPPQQMADGTLKVCRIPLPNEPTQAAGRDSGQSSLQRLVGRKTCPECKGDGERCAHWDQANGCPRCGGAGTVPADDRPGGPPPPNWKTYA